MVNRIVPLVGGLCELLGGKEKGWSVFLRSQQDLSAGSLCIAFFYLPKHGAMSLIGLQAPLGVLGVQGVTGLVAQRRRFLLNRGPDTSAEARLPPGPRN
jgi:hypothetical protein